MLYTVSCIVSSKYSLIENYIFKYFGKSLSYKQFLKQKYFSYVYSLEESDNMKSY